MASKAMTGVEYSSGSIKTSNLIEEFAFVLCHCRTFIGLTAESTGGLLETLVKATDSCLAEYNLPLYYEVGKCPQFTYALHGTDTCYLYNVCNVHHYTYNVSVADFSTKYHKTIYKAI